MTRNLDADRRRLSAALPAYDVGEEIGRGAWAVVFAGQHRTLRRQVAIKQLPTAFGLDSELRSRFVREARLLASLDHPHIVPIYDYVEDEGLHLLVMEHLRGGTVWERLRTTGIALNEAAAVLLAVCSALAYAHEREILHRDIKPENLLLTASGVPKLTDFGIAKLLGSTQTVVTVAGSVVGTPAYMAPEQAQGGPITPATDIYGCAVMLYELAAGSLPFPETVDPTVQLYQHVHVDPRPLAEVAAVPPAISEVVMRALEKAPHDRYQSAEEFGVALAEATTASMGSGWVEASGISVIDQGWIRAATLRAVDDQAWRRRPTVIVRGRGPERPSPSSPGARRDSVVGMEAPPVPAAGRGGAAVGGTSAGQGPTVLAALPPSGPGRPGRRRRTMRVALVVLFALVALAATVGGRWLVHSGGDETGHGLPLPATPAGLHAPRVRGPSQPVCSSTTTLSRRCPPGIGRSAGLRRR